MKNKINIAILIGRAGSKGLPGKNIKKITWEISGRIPVNCSKKI